LINIDTEIIKLNDYVRIRDVKGDPYIFFNLKTYKLVAIDVPEGSIEKKIIRLLTEKIKNGTRFVDLVKLVSEKFSLNRDEIEEDLKELIQKLLETHIVKIEDR